MRILICNRLLEYHVQYNKAMTTINNKTTTTELTTLLLACCFLVLEGCLWLVNIACTKISED